MTVVPRKIIQKVLFSLAVALLIAGALFWWRYGEQAKCWLVRASFAVQMVFAPDLPSEGIRIPLQILRERLFIEQPQSGATTLFLQVDTGCSASSFDPEAPLRVKASNAVANSIPGSVKNTHESRVIYVEGFKFAGREVPTMAVSGHSFDNTSSVVGRTVHGVIGQDILGNFLVELDYPHKVMLLKPLPNKSDDEGVAWDTHCPTAMVEIGDPKLKDGVLRAKGIVDCGSDIVTIPESQSKVLTGATGGKYMLMDDVMREGKFGTAPVSLANTTFTGLPVGAGTYDSPLIGNALLQNFSVTMDPRYEKVHFELHDWHGGNKLREALSAQKWADGMKLIGSDFPDDWREVNALLLCYEQLKQFQKAAALAARQIEKFPSEKNHWLCVQAGFLHAANQDKQAEELLAPFFSARETDPYLIVACVKALSDDPDAGSIVCARLQKKYPQCPTLEQIKQHLESRKSEKGR